MAKTTNTKIEKILADLKAQVESARKALEAHAEARNALLMEDNANDLAVSRANGKELEKACAKACKDAAFYELAFCNEDTIKAAIKARSYMTYVAKDVKDSESDSVSCEIEAREVFISLKELDTYCTTHGVKGSVDKSWDSEFKALAGAIVAQVVLSFTDEARKAEVLKVLKTDHYFSKALVKHEAALKNADLADPTSKTQILKLGQTMVEHLVGAGYVFKSEDYEFIKAAVTIYDRRTQYADIMKSRDLYNVNNKVFQHIVLGTPYELKAKKK